MPVGDALKAVAAFRLALPRTMLRFAGGREITLGDLGAKRGILGGINARDRRQLPDHPRPARGSRPGTARRATDAAEGTQRQPVNGGNRGWKTTRSGRCRRVQRVHRGTGGYGHADSGSDGSGAPPVLCAVRSPDGRPGPARRLVGALFSPRAGGLGRLGDTAVTEPPGFGGPSEPSGAPRTSRTRAVLFVMLGLSATGVLVGGLWAWIAPPIHAVVAITRAGERVHEYLGSESQNFFIAPFMLLGLLSVLAVVASALMWQWREHRGPQMVAGLSIGLTTAAAIAAGVGALVVRLRYGALDFDTVPLSRGDHALTYVTQAPPVFFARRPLQIALTLMWPAGIASLVYALLAAGTARDDLGGYPAVDPSSNARTEALETPQAPVS